MADRRHVLMALGAMGAAGAAGLGVGGRAFAQQSGLAVQPLSDSVFLVTGAGGNVVVVRGADGPAMLDGGAPDHAAALVDFVADSLGAPVSLLVNTHWHLHATGANDVLGAAGVPILAHVNTAQWMGAEFGVEWEDRRYAPRAAAARPTRTFRDAETIDLGAERLELRHLFQAHTDGDIVAFLPESNVLVAGGIAAPANAWPILDFASAGWIGGALDALETLLAMTNDDTRIVGETGPVLSRADLQAQYDMLFDVKERMQNKMREGKGVEDMLADGLTAPYDAQRGDPRLFVYMAWRGALYHLRELGGIIA